MALKVFLCAQSKDGRDSWLSTYVKLHKQPEASSMERKKSDQTLDFDIFVMWCTAFDTMCNLPAGQFKT